MQIIRNAQIIENFLNWSEYLELKLPFVQNGRFCHWAVSLAYSFLEWNIRRWRYNLLWHLGQHCDRRCPPMRITCRSSLPLAYLLKLRWHRVNVDYILLLTALIHGALTVVARSLHESNVLMRLMHVLRQQWFLVVMNRHSQIFMISWKPLVTLDLVWNKGRFWIESMEIVVLKGVGAHRTDILRVRLWWHHNWFSFFGPVFFLIKHHVLRIVQPMQNWFSFVTVRVWNCI